MEYTADEKNTLKAVHDIGVGMDHFFDRDMVFVVLAPHLGILMDLLKRIEPVQSELIFSQYEGVKRVMAMIGDSAQVLEKDLDLVK